MRARPRSSRTEGALRCRPCRAGSPSPDWWLGSEAENDREGGTRATAVAREEAPRVLAGRGPAEPPSGGGSGGARAPAVGPAAARAGRGGGGGPRGGASGAGADRSRDG